MLTRRNIATMTVVGLGLTACAGLPIGSNIPVLQTVQAWVRFVSLELPQFVQESVTTGLIAQDVVPKAQEYLKSFEDVANTFVSSTFTTGDAVHIANQVGTTLLAVASVIPAAAPYAALIQLAIGVIEAFVASTAINVPPIPTQAAVLQMHVKTAHWKKLN